MQRLWCRSFRACSVSCPRLRCFDEVVASCLFEGDLCFGTQDHVSAPPGLLVHELRAMATARRILSQQNIPGINGKVLALAGLKIECAAKGDDKLPDGRIMPSKGPSRFRLPKGDARGGNVAAQHVATVPTAQVDLPLLEDRLAVIASPDANAA